MSQWVREYLTSLLEAAFHQKHSLERLSDLEPKITEHLFKWFFIKGKDTDHWARELRGWSIALIRYDRVKTKKGRAYSRKTLEKLFWDYPFGDQGDLEYNAELFGLDPQTVASQKNEFRSAVSAYIDAVLERKPWGVGM